MHTHMEISFIRLSYRLLHQHCIQTELGIGLCLQNINILPTSSFLTPPSTTLLVLFPSLPPSCFPPTLTPVLFPCECRTQTTKSVKVVNSGSGLEKRSSGGIHPCEDLQCQAEGNPAQRLGERVIRLCAMHRAKQQRRRWWAGVQGTEVCRALGLCQGCG